MAERSVDRLAPYVNQLGKVSDDQIALMAGLSRNSVGAYRRKRGIPAYTGYLFESVGVSERAAPRRKPKAGRRQRGRVSKLQPFVHLLGVQTDAEVAAVAGVARASVTMYRNRNGIPASRQATPVGSAPRVAVQPERRGLQRSAFTLLARSGERLAEFVVLGRDMVDAAERAEAALRARADGPWRIDTLRLLGDALGAA
jgi:hypothetical protein